MQADSRYNLNARKRTSSALGIFKTIAMGTIFPQGLIHDNDAQLICKLKED
jgi:hypothetical protein